MTGFRIMEIPESERPGAKAPKVRFGVRKQPTVFSDGSGFKVFCRSKSIGRWLPVSSVSNLAVQHVSLVLLLGVECAVAHIRIQCLEQRCWFGRKTSGNQS